MILDCKACFNLGVVTTVLGSCECHTLTNIRYHPHKADPAIDRDIQRHEGLRRGQLDGPAGMHSGGPRDHRIGVISRAQYLLVGGVVGASIGAPVAVVLVGAMLWRRRRRQGSGDRRWLGDASPAERPALHSARS